jgi:hypothetical protein
MHNMHLARRNYHSQAGPMVALVASAHDCAAARQRAEHEARHIVDAWNVQLAQRRVPQFSPTLGCAINAGKPWLRLHCLGCHQVGEIDLRRIVRPRDFPITGLSTAVLRLKRCKWRAGPVGTAAITTWSCSLR